MYIPFTKIYFIADLPTHEIEGVFKVNVFGLLYCSKQAIKLMKENQKEAHIVNINRYYFSLYISFILKFFCLFTRRKTNKFVNY